MCLICFFHELNEANQSMTQKAGMICVVLILVSVLIATSGCITANVTSNKTASESNNDVSKGLVISAKPVSSPPQTMGGVAPHAGNVYVVYNCTVKNVGAEGVDLIAYYWHLRGPNGYYDAINKLPVQPPEMSHIDNSHVGDVASGYVFFEVPANAAKGPWTSLRFTNEGLGSLLGNSTFDLSVNI